METPETKKYTTKQMGDACEMLVAAELTLAGIPALKVPDLWPGYDVIAQPPNDKPLKISVKSRTFKQGAAFVSFQESDDFDWLAIVLLQCSGERPRRIFLVPRSVAASTARRDSPSAKTANERYWRIDEVSAKLAGFEDNFKLQPTGRNPAIGQAYEEDPAHTPARSSP
jgi:hypothetical protein